MNFEEALKRVILGTATEEERAFVIKQLALVKEEPDQPDEPQPDLETALSHIESGAASEREIAYVRERIIAANKEPAKDPGAEPKKKSRLGRAVTIAACALLGVIVAVGAILGGVFGYAASCASGKDWIGRDRATEYAKEEALAFLREHTASPLVSSAAEFFVEEVERDFHYNGRDLAASYYTYEIKLIAKGTEIEVLVDTRGSETAARSTYVTVVDYDGHR